MLLRSIFLLFLFTLMQAHEAYSQTFISFTKYGAGKGLPSNLISVVEQDNSGNIWVGTDKGLAFKESEKFTTHIKEKHITSIAPDDAGFLWVGSTSGLIRFQIDSGSTELLTHKQGDKSSLAGNHVTDVAIGENNVIWVATINSGISAYYRQSNVFEQYSTTTTGLASDKVTAVELIGERLAIATADAGLAIMSPVTGELKICKRGSDSKSLPANEINTLYYDEGQARLWVGTKKGLACLPLSSIESESYEFFNFPKGEKEKTISGEDVAAITTDRSASMWIGTSDGGLSRMVFQSKTDLKNYIVQQYERDPEKEASLSSNNITCIKKASSGRLWVGTDNKLNKFSPTMQTYKQVEAFFSNIFSGFDEMIFGKPKSDTTKTEPEEDTDKTSVSGVFMYNKNNPGANVEMQLMNSEKKEIETTKTDDRGRFRFENLPKDETYIILVKTRDGKLSPYARIYLTNENGEKVARMMNEEGSYFTFKALPKDEYAKMEPLNEEDGDLLSVNVYGRLYEKIPGDYPEGIEVMIVNDEGEILYVTRTKEGGYFEFKELPPDKHYMFKLHAEDSEGTLVILDENGNVIRKLDENQRAFDYQYLPPDAVMLTLVNEEDVELIIQAGDNFIISNVYYDYNKYNINNAAARELDKLVKILKKNPHVGVQIESHTDSRGTDSYNKDLSRKRAMAAVEYIVSKGISKERITGKGYGAEQLVNDCKQGTDCSERQHAKNRRTEFKIVAAE